MTPALMRNLLALTSPQFSGAPVSDAGGAATVGTAVDRTIINPSGGSGSTAVGESTPYAGAGGLAMSCDLIAQAGAVNAGTFTLDTKLQHNDVSTGGDSGWADYTPPDGVAAHAAVTQITTANSLGRRVIDLSAAKRYIRTKRTVVLAGGATSLLACDTITLGGFQNPPIANS